MDGWVVGQVGAHGLVRSLPTCLAALVIAIGVLGGSRASAAAIPRTSAGLLYAQHPCTFVYTAPSASAAPITALLGGTDVTDAGPASTPGWRHVRIWSGLDAYAQDGDLGTTPPPSADEGNCEFPGVPDPQDDFLPAARRPRPLAADRLRHRLAALHALRRTQR